MRIIDTGNTILSGDNHPQLKIGDKLYIVDDRRSTFEKIQKIQNDESIENAEIKALELALGKAAVKELVEKNDISVSGFQNLTLHVIAAITGEDFEELRKATKERKN
ncbi:MAG: hypothetical protein J6L91_07445 [Clostridia bacterium]|nr:hypothetical protein [Clostridia bacterium]